MSKEIFIRNKQRELQSKLSGRYEGYQPEHERLNRAPQVENVSEDFRYSRRFPLTVQKPEPVQQPPPPFRPPMAIASGHNEEELSWIQRPIPRHDESPNHEVIGYDDVSEPGPPLPEGPRLPDPILPSAEPRPVSIDDICEGSYFVVVTDTIIAEAPELNFIEELVEQMVFDSTNSIVLDDIVVLRKMKIKVGIGVS